MFGWAARLIARSLGFLVAQDDSCHRAVTKELQAMMNEAVFRYIEDERCTVMNVPELTSAILREHGFKVP